MRRSLYIFLLSLSVLSATAQEDIFDLLDDESESAQYTYATFKGTKLLNGQTNETPGQGVLQYIISHRFGSFTDEYLYNFFGLDNAQLLNQDVLNVSPIYEECAAGDINGVNDGALDFVESPSKSAVILIKTFADGSSDNCEPFFIYLKNRDAFRKNSDRENWPEEILKEGMTKGSCSKTNGGVAAFVAKEAFQKENFEKTFKVAKKACELKDYDSCGLASYVTLFKKIPQNKGLDKLGQKNKN